MTEHDGYYVDGTNYSTFAHLNHRTNNFVEKVGQMKSYTATSNTASFAAAPSKTFKVRKLGQFICLEIPAQAATVTNATSAASWTALLEASYRPIITFKQPIVMLDNAATVIGYKYCWYSNYYTFFWCLYKWG